MKDEYFFEVFIIYYFKQNTWIIKIKYKNHNYLLIFAEAYTTYQRVAIIDNIKLKIIT